MVVVDNSAQTEALGIHNGAINMVRVGGSIVQIGTGVCLFYKQIRLQITFRIKTKIDV